MRCLLFLLVPIVAMGCANGHTGRRGTGRDSGSPPIDAGSGFDAGGGPDAGASCPTGQMFCDGACRDVSVDPAHCGDCVTACAGGEVCSGGACALSCSGGTTACGGSCVDTSTDETNCGGCGIGCASDETCTGGTCTALCSGGTTWCSGTCVDTDTDEMHCGDCATSCAAGETCVGGSCTAPSSNGCADGSVEVTWSSTVHGCRGPTSDWGHYSDNASTYCASGWAMAGADIVNSVLTGPGYTDDVRYAFNGEGCDGHDYFVTRYDSYSQTRSSCGWSDSHHWSYASTGRAGLAHGIVCEKLP